MDINDQERQLIEILREWAGDRDSYRLQILYSMGAYEIELSMPEKKKVARGVGTTFGEAWDNVAPNWA